MRIIAACYREEDVERERARCKGGRRERTREIALRRLNGDESGHRCVFDRARIVVGRMAVRVSSYSRKASCVSSKCSGTREYREVACGITQSRITGTGDVGGLLCRDLGDEERTLYMFRVHGCVCMYACPCIVCQKHRAFSDSRELGVIVGMACSCVCERCDIVVLEPLRTFGVFRNQCMAERND